LLKHITADLFGAATRVLAAAERGGLPGAVSLRRFVSASRARIDVHRRRRILRNSRFVWLREPATLRGRRACLLACFSDRPELSPHTLRLAEAWRAEGFVVILVVATNRHADLVASVRCPDSLDGMIVRENCGYDFGSWSVAIHGVKGLRDASLLVLANDSVFGPIGSLRGIVERVAASPADVVAMTESFEKTHHFQSYLAFYKPAAIRHRAFRSFWRRCEAGDRQEIIDRFELTQWASLESGGLAVDALFRQEATDLRNPTLTRWRALIDAGFPFVKVALLRENPFDADLIGWESVLERHGYDPAIVRAGLPGDAAIGRSSAR
jgi:hypothetical protein